MMRLLYLTALFLISNHALLGQVEHPTEKAHSPALVQRHNTLPHFRVAGFISHTFIPGVAEGQRIAIPSYGIDLEYWWSKRLGIGMHNDLELETFIIESGREEFLEREYPVVSSLDILYCPWRGLVLQVGPGVEIDRNKSFFLFRFGIEYEVEIGHHWDLYPTLFYDTREDAYTTLSLGLGVGKRF